MKKFIFIFTTALALLCNIGVKSQIMDSEEWARERTVNAVNWISEHFKDFDREKKTVINFVCLKEWTLNINRNEKGIFFSNNIDANVQYQRKIAGIGFGKADAGGNGKNSGLALRPFREF
jgi:hypothetical protein